MVGRWWLPGMHRAGGETERVNDFDTAGFGI
jgi:hypothetical protein